MTSQRRRCRAAAPCALALFALTAPAVARAAVGRAVRGTPWPAITSPCPPPTATRLTCMELVRHRGTGSDGDGPDVARGVAAVGPAGGDTPADLQTAYGVRALAATAGVGQIVAIVDAYGDSQLPGDLAAFDAEYDLPACGPGCLDVVNETGQSAPLPADNIGWTGETALDVETVHAICERCTIDLVQATSASAADLAQAEDTAVALGADIVSNSYAGWASAQSAGEAAAYNHPGVAILAAAGDAGYDDWDDPAAFGDPGQPNTPAAFPTVIAVGGTSLVLSAAGTREAEIPWNDDDGLADAAGASGGGCSTLFAAPAWQTALPDWNQTGCGSGRLDNDVSADGDPNTGFDVYDSTAGGWATVGGTSLSTPLMAALMALAGGPGGVAYPAASLYAHREAAPRDFYDVTAAGNGQCDGLYLARAICADGGDASSVTDCGDTLACDAGPGYDGPSGVGAPAGIAGLTPVTPPPPRHRRVHRRARVHRRVRRHRRAPHRRGPKTD